MSNNYTLGRGELHFARYLTGTQNPGGERYLGNSPEFNATIESENLDHFNSDRGIREKDASIVLEVNRTASFITDNVNPDNISLFFFGEKFDVAVVGAAAPPEVITAIIPGLSYQLGMSPSAPAGVKGLDMTTPPAVSDADTPATVYVAGTDYVIDPTLGRITILTEGSIASGSNISVTYSTATSTRERVISGSTPVEGALRYISFNPAGKQYDWYMPYVKLTPNGDYQLKGDEWQQIPFNVEILRKGALEAIYVEGRPLVAGS